MIQTNIKIDFDLCVKVLMLLCIMAKGILNLLACNEKCYSKDQFIEQ